MNSKNCLYCGKLFYKLENCSINEWTNRRKFCSKECCNLYKVGKPSNSSTKFCKGMSPWNKGEKGLHLSPDTEFKKGNKPWTTGKKISTEHYEKLKAAGFFNPKFGNKSSNWKGGTTKLGQLIRSSNKNLDWRAKVFERDNWTCVMCFRKRKPGDRVILHVDHIKPFYLILQENKIKNLEQALACEELWDVSNGRVLCVECHRKTETYRTNQYTKVRVSLETNSPLL